jgi:hypothetical protein
MLIPHRFPGVSNRGGVGAFAGKKIEYGEMMDDHAAGLEAVIQRQLAVVEGLES